MAKKEHDLPKILSAIPLEPGKFYVFNIEGAQELPKEQLSQTCTRLKEMLKEHNIDGVFAVTPFNVSVAEVTKSEFLKEEEINEQLRRN